jgi:hypothetical protein
MRAICANPFSWPDQEVSAVFSNGNGICRSGASRDSRLPTLLQAPNEREFVPVHFLGRIRKSELSYFKSTPKDDT